MPASADRVPLSDAEREARKQKRRTNRELRKEGTGEDGAASLPRRRTGSSSAGGEQHPPEWLPDVVAHIQAEAAVDMITVQLEKPVGEGLGAQCQLEYGVWVVNPSKGTQSLSLLLLLSASLFALN